MTAAVMCAQAIRRASAKVLHGFPSGWRNSVMPPERTTFKVGDGHAAHEVAVSYRSRRDGTFAMTIGEAERTVAAYSAGEGGADLEIDGRRVQFAVAGSGDRWFVHGADYDVELVELPRLPLPEQYEIKGGLTAPMPGNVLATHIAEGDAVAEGQLLLVLEAMKMQHRITAPFDGTVKEVHVAEGQQVDNGALLVLLEESEPSGEEPR
ncbi:MAG: biotin/lipoyl-binding protein [Gammaproteobacteria bacterium]|nr:biotin/lipoyl-binding protein [Gammaproteobacteria bacterium]